MEYGSPLPRNNMRVGVYIDDLIITIVVPLQEMSSPFGSDRSAMLAALAAYEEHNLPVSHEKGFGFGDLGKQTACASPNFTAWGTAVTNRPGDVGTDPHKRLLISLSSCILYNCQ